MQKPSIAICHLREDAAAARVLADKLAKSGADPWLIQRPSELGEDWEDLLERSVRDSDAMVVCLRPGFEAKAKSQEEVGAALRVNNQAPFGPNFLIPFILEPVAGDRPSTIEGLVEAVNLQCASQLTLPGGSGPYARPASLARPDSGAERRSGPSGVRSQAFSVSPPKSRLSGGVRVAMGILLIILVAAVGYWYWPEGTPIDFAAEGGRSQPADSRPKDSSPAPLVPISVEPAQSNPEPTPTADGTEAPASAEPVAEPGELGGRLEVRESPSRLAGRAHFKPEAIVIHTMDSGQEQTEQWQMNPKSAASMHYAVGLNGQIFRYVMEVDTAFHLGRKASSTWPLFKPDVDPNLYTMGIDHEGLAGQAWPENQVRASAALIRRICLRWNIPIDRRHVLGHHEAFPLDIPTHRDNPHRQALSGGRGRFGPSGPSGGRRTG